MSNYCDELFVVAYRSDISYVNLNIYYYCSVSRTSLPILTVIISPDQGLRPRRLFYLINTLFIHFKVI